MAAYDFRYDEATGIVRCRMISFISDADALNYVRDMEKVISTARSDSPAVRVLFDNRDGVVVSATVLAHFGQALSRIRHPGDRVAILVGSSLAKMQAKRAVNTNHEVFISEAAAITWLDAWKGQETLAQAAK